jgi:hypothetical protein
MRTIGLAALLFFFHHDLLAQEVERIDTDRPDQTESAVTLPRKVFQMEFGFGKMNLADKDYNFSHPTFLFKYGLVKRVELRLEGNLFSEHDHLILDPKTTTRFDALEVGTKIALFEEKGWRPKTSFLGHLGLPFTASDVDPAQTVFGSLRLSFQHTLSERAGLGYNVGAVWDGFTNRPTWMYTFSPNINIGKRWYAYVETFGFFRDGEAPQNSLDAGMAYYVSNETKLDLSGGIGLGSNPMRNYVAIGASFRFRPKNK